MASSEQNTKALLSTAASIAASAMLIRSIANDFLPNEIHGFFSSALQSLFRRFFSSELTIVVEEFQGYSPNEVFEAATTYLGTKAPTSAQRFKVGKSEDQKLTITMDRDEEIIDTYNNIQVKWRFVCSQVESTNFPGNEVDLNASLRSEVRSFELSFHKKNKEKVLNSYLPYVLNKSKSIQEENKVIKLHTIARYEGGWGSDPIVLDHPMTFKTLAVDKEIKESLLEDMNAFMNGKQYYRDIGKAWKRGYLLYGPPGTGKSSLIAAMANYLNYDIYDMELSEVRGNSDLRSLLLRMSSKSILVIEDIDCTIKLQNRDSDDEVSNGKNQVTLSGLLNFIDGLWSCCGEERIIVFTTNHKERLDPALLRPGRMDVHINMSYCTFSAFKQLAFNYIGIYHHELFVEIERLLVVVEVSPAEVAGKLMKRNDVGVCLDELVQFLKSKMVKERVKQKEEDGENV